MAFPETDESGKFLRPKQAARGQSFFGATNESRLGIDKQNAARMGISLDAYRRGWHKDLGGEDWLDRLPKEARLEDLQRGLADLYAQKDVERDRENSPLTQQEKDVKEYKDAIVELEKRRLQKEYNEQQRALGLGGRNAMMSNPALASGIPAEDVMTVAQLSPYWKAAALTKFGYDIATKEEPSLLDAALATGGYGSKTEIGKRIVDRIKDISRRVPKKVIAAGTLPFFASDVKKGDYPIYPKEETSPKPVKPKGIDYSRGVKDQIDRIRAQQLSKF